jgi:hypothetical protein
MTLSSFGGFVPTFPGKKEVSDSSEKSMYCQYGCLYSLKIEAVDYFETLVYSEDEGNKFL